MVYPAFGGTAGGGGVNFPRLGFGVFCLALPVLIGCGSQGKIAAVVNGHVISSREVDDRLARMNPMMRQSIGNDRRRVVEQMITEAILFQEAGRRGLGRDSEVRQLLQEARRQILIGRLLEGVRQELSGTVSEGEIAQFYEVNRSNFAQAESWRASHILASDSGTAEKALARVKSGESFAQVAQEVSTDPSKTRGGDIGFFSQGQVIPEFESACRDLNPGELSKVVKTPLGYHVILLTERRSAREKTLDEVQDQVRQILDGQQSQKKLESFLQQLRSKAQVKIHETSVPAAAPAQEPGTAVPSHSSP